MKLFQSSGLASLNAVWKLFSGVHDVTALLNWPRAIFVTRVTTRVYVNGSSGVTVNQNNIPIADFES
jgi:hypothetical protein